MAEAAVMDDHVVDDTIAKRNAIVLAGGQMLGGACSTILMTISGIIGTTLAPHPSWATVPITAFVLGQAMTTLPARSARLARCFSPATTPLITPSASRRSLPRLKSSARRKR